MRWFFLSVFSLLFPVLCWSQIVLNEAYYDHAGADEGYEFVEILNLTGSPVPLAGCALEFHDGASSGWLTIWRAMASDTIGANGLFVVGGVNVTPPPNALSDLALQNGPDAIRLVAEERVLDLLGYGLLGDAQYFEGTPAPDVESGMSLSRQPDGADSGDNGKDFAAAAPSPGRFNTARRDVALRLAAGTPLRDSRAGAGVEVLPLFVVNLGLEPVSSGEAAAEIVDSTDIGEERRVSAPITHGIAAGDSARVDIAVDLSTGIHRLRGRAVYPADERPENDVVVVLRRVGASALVVSEVMSFPRSGCPEYVELFNSGAVPYDLAGHWIHDAAHAPERIVSAEKIIPPWGFTVLTADAEGLVECFPGIDPDAIVEIEGHWPTLNQTASTGEADSIVILDEAFLPVERIAYPPQPAGTDGRSLERVDLYPGPGPHAWVLSSAESGGSPGRRSPNSSVAPPEGARVRASPNPFDPYRSEVLVVTIPSRDEPARAVVGVFDISGRRIADLGTATVFPSTLVWDGRESGEIVLPGIYLVACEFFSESNGSRRVERVVVGCGRRTHSGISR